jgi:hypothetical protein
MTSQIEKTTPLKYKKTFKGGGDYITFINGKLVTIEKQFKNKTWIAQTWDGEIDIERDTLTQIKYVLEKIKA